MSRGGTAAVSAAKLAVQRDEKENSRKRKIIKLLRKNSIILDDLGNSE
jgi:hypothetical protein